MSHMIEFNQLAYKGAKPWHGLGVEVPADATGAEMQKIAGLDWVVESVPMAMQGHGATGSYNITAGLDRFRIVRRADTLQPFQTASKIWKAVQPSEIVNFFREFCEAGNATMQTVGGLKGGAIIWALAKLNGSSDTKIGNAKSKDDVRGYIVLATSYDGSIPTIARPTQICVVCWNTLRAALQVGEDGKTYRKAADDEFRLIHSQKFDEKAKQAARERVGMAIEQVQMVNEAAQELSKVSIDPEGRLQFVERLLLKKGDLVDTIVSDQQPAGSALDAAIAQTQGMTKEAREKRIGFVGRSILEAMLNSPGSDYASRKDTWWGAVNGVTFYSDHAAKAFSVDNRVYQSMFDKNDTLKSKALELAIEMTGVKVAQA